jgi:hypothetical protein
MPRRNAAPAREQAAGRKQTLMSIGRRLRDEYAATQPLPDRLLALAKKVEKKVDESSTESESERAREATSTRC